MQLFYRKAGNLLNKVANLSLATGCLTMIISGLNHTSLMVFVVVDDCNPNHHQKAQREFADAPTTIECMFFYENLLECALFNWVINMDI